MGLLDTFLNGTGDPQKDAVINRGLLQAGLALMQSRGKLFPALGQAGMAGLQASDQMRQQQQQQQRSGLQDQLLKNQLAQQRQQQEMEALPGQFYKPPGAATVDATGGTETQAQPATPGGFDMAGYIQALMAKAPTQALALQAAMKKDTTPIVSKPGDIARDPTTGAVTWQNPESTKVVEGPSAVQEYQFAQKQGYTGTFEQWKQAQKPPGVQVSYGQPVAGVDASGAPVFFQPSKDGKTAPSIVQGVKPAPQNRDTKLPAEIQRMNIAADTMGSMLNRYEAMLAKHNPRDPVTQMNPSVRAEFQSLMKAIQLQFKEVQALGALAGPDLAIMEAAITDPFTMKGAYYGKDGLKGQIRQARELLKERRAAINTSQGKDGPTADNDPLGLRK